MEYLFERLVDGAGERGAGADLKERVRNQVQRLVCTCSRDGRDEPMDFIDFGMPGITEVRHGNLSQLEHYALRLKRLIERYEPRLANVSVELEPSGELLSPYRVAVIGVLAPGGEEQMFRFDADT